MSPAADNNDAEKQEAKKKASTTPKGGVLFDYKAHIPNEQELNQVNTELARFFNNQASSTNISSNAEFKSMVERLGTRIKSATEDYYNSEAYAAKGRRVQAEVEAANAPGPDSKLLQVSNEWARFQALSFGIEQALNATETMQGVPQNIGRINQIWLKSFNTELSDLVFEGTIGDNLKQSCLHGLEIMAKQDPTNTDIQTAKTYLINGLNAQDLKQNTSDVLEQAAQTSIESKYGDTGNERMQELQQQRIANIEPIHKAVGDRLIRTVINPPTGPVLNTLTLCQRELEQQLRINGNLSNEQNALVTYLADTYNNKPEAALQLTPGLQATLTTTLAQASERMFGPDSDFAKEERQATLENTQRQAATHLKTLLQNTLVDSTGDGTEANLNALLINRLEFIQAAHADKITQIGLSQSQQQALSFLKNPASTANYEKVRAQIQTELQALKSDVEDIVARSAIDEAAVKVASDAEYKATPNTPLATPNTDAALSTCTTLKAELDRVVVPPTLLTDNTPSPKAAAAKAAQLQQLNKLSHLNQIKKAFTQGDGKSPSVASSVANILEFTQTKRDAESQYNRRMDALRIKFDAQEELKKRGWWQGQPNKEEISAALVSKDIAKQRDLGDSKDHTQKVTYSYTLISSKKPITVDCHIYWRSREQNQFLKDGEIGIPTHKLNDDQLRELALKMASDGITSMAITDGEPKDVVRFAKALAAVGIEVSKVPHLDDVALQGKLAKTKQQYQQGRTTFFKRNHIEGAQKRVEKREAAMKNEVATAEAMGNFKEQAEQRAQEAAPKLVPPAA